MKPHWIVVGVSLISGTCIFGILFLSNLSPVEPAGPPVAQGRAEKGEIPQSPRPDAGGQNGLTMPAVGGQPAARTRRATPAPPAVDVDVIEIDARASVPAALADTGSELNLTPRQKQMVENIAQEFLRTIAEGGSQGSEAQLGNWEAAQQAADETYRIFLGGDLYRMQKIRAAIQAHPNTQKK